jgi:peptidoglycan/LPS O-acetylase OafA/YrhL
VPRKLDDIALVTKYASPLADVKTMMLLQSTSRVRVLDALRGLAAAIVVWHHVFVVFGTEFQGLKDFSGELFWLASFISDQNKNAVLLFFVLSGFSIRLSLNQGWPVSAPDAMHYAARRAFRILPLYWFALAATFVAAFVLFGADHPSFSMSNLAGNLVFLQTSESAAGNWFPPFGMNGPLWSLSFEIFYYACFPALAWTAIKLGGISKASALLVAFCFVLSLAGLALNLVAPSPFSNFMSLWLVWMLGFDLAETWLRKRASIALPLAPLALAALLAVEFVVAESGMTSDTLELLRNGTLIATLGYIVVSSDHRVAASAMRLVSNALLYVFERVGTGSYALYLLHVPLLLSIKTFVPSGAGTSSPLVTWSITGVLVIFAVGICPPLERLFARLRPTALGRKATEST